MLKKATEKRNYILKCAEEVFIEKGFTVVTMKDIIDACKISRGGLYLYFNSVDEIFMNVINLYQKDNIKIIIEEFNEENDFFIALDKYFEQIKNKFVYNKRSLKLAMLEFFLMHKDHSEKEFFVNATEGLRAPLLEIISYGLEHQLIPYVSVNILADTVMFWILGFEEVVISTDVSETIIEQQLIFIKNLVLNGKIL